MADKLKVFKNENITPALGSTYSIVTTDGTTQCNVKGISIVNNSTGKTGIEVKHGNRVIATLADNAKTDIEGAEIIDTNDSLTLNIQGAITPNRKSNDVIYFSDTNTSKLEISTVGNVNSNTDLGDNNQNSNSAIIVKKGGVFTCARTYTNQIFLSAVATPTVTDSTVALSSSGYQLCADDTYMYTTKTGGFIKRVHIETLAVDDLIVTGLPGGASNGGGYFECYKNSIYQRVSGISTSLSVVNLTTLARDVISIPTIGTYCIGSTITTYNDEDYLVEVGSSAINIIRLRDMNVFVSTAPAPGGSTEYGNAAFELKEGVVAFHDGTLYREFTLTGSGEAIDGTVATKSLGVASQGTYLSIATYSPYSREEDASIDLDVYAQGVESTGV